MSTPSSAFGDVVLRRQFDSGTVARGVPYAYAGKVLEYTTSDDGTSVEGVVAGSGAQTYETTVTLSPTRAGGIRLSTSCSCPVGYECKHAVALVVAVREGLEPDTLVPLRDAASPEPALPRRAPSGGWRTALAPLTTSHGQRPLTRWALEVRLVRGQYGPGFLVARPYREGARGGWVKSGATWGDVHTAHVQRPDDDASQALDHLNDVTQRDAYGYSRGDGTVELTSAGSELWTALAAVVDAGVPILASSTGPDVVVSAEPVDVGLGLVPGDGVVLQPWSSDDEVGAALDAGSAVLLGSPAHGVAVEHEGAVRLARLSAPLDVPTHQLVHQRRPVVVPPDDVEEFWHDHYPRLARSGRLAWVDPTLAAPELSPPRLAATVTHAGSTATFTWGFAYDVGERVVRVPMATTREAFRDVVGELRIATTFVPPEGPLDIARPAAPGRRPSSPQTFSGYDVVLLVEDTLPLLAEAGVHVLEDGERPDFRHAESAPVVSVSVDDPPDGRTDWYDLAVTVSIDGEQIPFELLFASLAAGESHLVLPSGTYLSIDLPELVALRDLILEARDLQDRRREGLRVTRFHAALFDELANLGVVERQSSRWQASVGGLTAVDDVEVPAVPASFTAELRPYQLEGYAWLSFLADHGLGGILADDMGLGKTVQTLAMVQRQVERGSGPFLVVAPTSVVGNWAREAARFAPGLTVATIAQTERKRGTSLADEVAGADLVVTSYALFRLEHDGYRSVPWAGLLLDEAQFVKNHQGKTYQCARRLDAPFKLAITGTPLENSLMDLWAMLSIVAPGLYPDPRRFADSYQKPIESGQGRERLALLQRRVRPLMRRRTKEEVAVDLPPKTEQVLEVPLGPQHARIYQMHLQRERQKVLGLLADETDDHRFEVLRSLTLLRQLSLDPALVDEAHDAVGSAKIDLLVEHLGEVLAEGHRALVFSQFTGYLQRVRARLDAEGITTTYLDGRTRKREEAIAAFTEGDAPVFLISLKAGGFGLNLTQADYCYVLDPWWNPASEAQAVDRAHRIGQTRPVMVYRLVSADTIEHKVMELKERKAALFASVMGDDAELAGSLTADDIRGLLGA